MKTSLEISEFPVPPEMENSHWLKGDKSVITSWQQPIMIMSRCVLQLVAVVFTNNCAVIHNGAVVLKIGSCFKERFISPFL